MRMQRRISGCTALKCFCSPVNLMHGHIFDVEYKKDETVVISVSFGGLLMRLTGEQKHLSAVQPDMRLCILMKKD